MASIGPILFSLALAPAVNVPGEGGEAAASLTIKLRAEALIVSPQRGELGRARASSPLQGERGKTEGGQPWQSPSQEWGQRWH